MEKSSLIPDTSINRTKLGQFLAAQGGRIVSVEFIKKDGSTRKLVGRQGVKKNLKGGVNPAAAPKFPYAILFDLQKQDYRCVNLGTVYRVKAGGRTLTVNNY